MTSCGRPEVGSPHRPIRRFLLVRDGSRARPHAVDGPGQRALDLTFCGPVHPLLPALDDDAPRIGDRGALALRPCGGTSRSRAVRAHRGAPGRGPARPFMGSQTSDPTAPGTNPPLFCRAPGGGADQVSQMSSTRIVGLRPTGPVPTYGPRTLRVRAGAIRSIVAPASSPIPTLMV